MSLTKGETNNGIITRLTNVRPHSNADRLQLATVLGNTVVVGLEANEGDLILYFDSNLALSEAYLRENNLYGSPERNKDPEKKGYFGKNGRVKAQKFRGEISNGFVAPIDSLTFTGVDLSFLKEGVEFQDVNGVGVCLKFISINTHTGLGTGAKRKTKEVIRSNMFHRHWDTKQLMRNLEQVPELGRVYCEEKVHGTSGRTGRVLCNVNHPWYKPWAPKQVWEVVSGTRRVDNVKSHLREVREEIQRRVEGHLRKGEEVYYEIFGYGGQSQIQNGYTYGCRPGEFRVMLYRVTITTPDGFVVDLPRQQVYNRADEIGMEKPLLLWICPHFDVDVLTSQVMEAAQGRSHIDPSTLLEGVVVWFEGLDGKWACLKHKSEEFLLKESKDRDKEIGDVEDTL